MSGKSLTMLQLWKITQIYVTILRNHYGTEIGMGFPKGNIYHFRCHILVHERDGKRYFTYQLEFISITCLSTCAARDPGNVWFW